MVARGVRAIASHPGLATYQIRTPVGVRGARPAPAVSFGQSAEEGNRAARPKRPPEDGDVLLTHREA